METTEEKRAFTLGPWQLSCIDGVEDSLMVGGGDDGSDIVADIRDRDEANARLIAAAPEMYEVLREIEMLMPHSKAVKHSGLREVLAKVEGGEG